MQNRDARSCERALVDGPMQMIVADMIERDVRMFAGPLRPGTQPAHRGCSNAAA